MKTCIFTFGCGQKYANHYVKITAIDAMRCRELMFENYGKSWSFMYNSEEDAGVHKWGYKLLEEIKDLSN